MRAQVALSMVTGACCIDCYIWAYEMQRTWEELKSDKPSKYVPSSILLLDMPKSQKIQWPPKTMPPARDQVFKQPMEKMSQSNHTAT